MFRKTTVLCLVISSFLNILTSSSSVTGSKIIILDKSPASITAGINSIEPKIKTSSLSICSETEGDPLMNGHLNKIEDRNLVSPDLFNLGGKKNPLDDALPVRKVSFAFEDDAVSDNENVYEIESEFGDESSPNGLSVVEEDFEGDESVCEARENFDEFYEPEPTEEEAEIIQKYLGEDDILRLPLTVNHYLPAYKAALKSDMKTLKKIVGLNISLDAYDIKTGETPIHAAIRRGNMEIIKFILSKAKNWNPLSRNGNGRTPFAVAVSSGQDEIVLWMIRHSGIFDIKTPDNDGRSPIMLAALNDEQGIFKIMRAIGSNVLHRDHSGRSLLTILPPTNPIHKSIMAHLKDQYKNDKEHVIRRLAPELGMIYRNEDLGGPTLVMSFFSELGISLSEFVSAPQPQDSNLLMAILDVKEYTLYQSLVSEINFDINDTEKSAEFDKTSFFNRCLQIASRETLDFLFENETPLINIHSFEAIFSFDRIQALKAIEAHIDFDLYVNDINLIVPSGLAKANKCIRYLGFKFFKVQFPSLQGTNFFCEAAVSICEAAKTLDVIENLFETFPKAMASCSKYELSFFNRKFKFLTNIRRILS